MQTALITVDAPEPFFELEDAKKHLRVDSDFEDDLIKALIAAVCSQLDGPQGILERAISQQTLKLVLPGFPPFFTGRCSTRHHRQDVIQLPMPPVIAVTALAYFDQNNAPQTLAADNYSFVQCGTSPSILLPAFDKRWPQTACRPDAVSITFTAGFADDDENPTVPGPIIAAAKLILGDLFANREATVYSTGAALENPAVKALLSPWRNLTL